MSKDVMFYLILFVLIIISGFIAIYAPVVFEVIGMATIFIGFSIGFAKH
jgi:hypothetical protein